MSRLSDIQRELLRHIVGVQKQNRNNSVGMHMIVPKSGGSDETFLMSQGFIVEVDGFPDILLPTPAGIAALAEADAIEFMRKFERAFEQSSPNHAVDQLSTVVFELAKRVGILEANA